MRATLKSVRAGWFGIVVLLLELNAIVSAADNTPADLLGEARQIYRAKGAEECRAFVRKNIETIKPADITRFAAAGLGEPNDEAMTIAHILAEEKNDEKTQATVNLIHGDFFSRHQDYQAANRYLDLAMPVYEKLKFIRGQGNVWKLRAEISIQQNDYNRALEYIQKAQLLYESENNPLGLGNVYYIQGFIFRMRGDNATAVEMYSKAIPFYEKADSLSSLGNAYQDLADVFYQTGDSDNALKTLSKALPITEKAGDIVRQGHILVGMAMNYFRIGEKDRSLSLYQQALPLFKKAGHMVGQGNAYHGIGEYYLYTCDFTKAMEALQQALDCYIRGEDSLGQGNVYLDLGNIAFRSGDYVGAIKKYDQALPLYQKVEDPLGQGNLLTSKGICLFRLGNREKALEMFGQAKQFFIKAGDPIGQANIFFQEGEIFRKFGQYEEALARYQQAEPLYAKVGDILDQGYIYERFGDILYHQKKWTQSMAMNEKAMAIYIKTGDLESEAAALCRKGKTIYRMGQKNEMLILYGKGIALFEKMRRQTPAAVNKSGFIDKISGFYEDAINDLLAEHVNEQAFQVVESRKARVFLDSLAEGLAGLGKGVPPQLAQQRREIEAKITTLNKERSQALQQEPLDTANLSKIQAGLAKTESDLETLIAQIRTQNPLYASLQYPEPTTLAKFQQALHPEETVLEYVLTSGPAYCFVIEKERAVAVKLPVTAGGLQLQVKNWLMPVSKGSETLSAKLSSELYHSLLAPVRRYIRGSTLIIVPEGVLARLPFEALPLTDKGKQSYLLEQYRVKYIQSASVLRLLRSSQQGANPAADGFIGFGDPVYDFDNFKKDQPEKGVTQLVEDTAVASLRSAGLRYARTGGKLDRLASSGQEVSVIGEHFRKSGLPNKILLRQEATEENAKASEMAQYGYIHFSAHGVLDGEFQAIALSQIPENKEDGFLTLGEIMNCKYNARLVVLSACESGLGKLDNTEGVTGLTRAVMFAGTPAAVVSLWNVSDQATAELMDHFYRNLLEGRLSKEEALRQAKLGLLKSPAYLHPFFWASFVMYGE